MLPVASLLTIALSNKYHVRNMQNYYYKIFILFIFSLIARNSIANQITITEDNKYTPIIAFSATKSKRRTIGEIDFMLPMWQKQNDLTLLDIKYKKDKKSYEYNLGLVYRHNNDDKWIWGIYGYFDRRKTENKLHANQWTFGSEILSRYFDSRLNFYIPQNKKKTLYVKPKEFRRDHTSVYAISDGKFQEHTLAGYDIEVGMPLFALAPQIDEKLGTKIYLAKYDFRRKKVARNSGIRVRLEQKILENKLNNKVILTLHLGTHYTNQKKWDNFIGLNVRVPLSTVKTSRTKIQDRMMDTVVRDVDLRTEKRISRVKEPLYLHGKEIHNIYFVSDGGGGGNGSYENPFSMKQLLRLAEKGKTDFIIIPTGTFTQDSYNSLLSQGSVIEATENEPVILYTNSGDASFDVKAYIPELQKQERVLITENIPRGNYVLVDENERIIPSNRLQEDNEINSGRYHNSPEYDKISLKTSKNIHKMESTSMALISSDSIVVSTTHLEEMEPTIMISTTSAIHPQKSYTNLKKLSPLKLKITSPLQESAVHTMNNPRVDQDACNAKTNGLKNVKAYNAIQERVLKTMLKPMVDHDFSSLKGTKTGDLKNVKGYDDIQRRALNTMLTPRVDRPIVRH